MTDGDPWADIGAANTTDTMNTRRADAEHPLDFFWGRDNEGRHAFLFRCGYDLAPHHRRPKLAGIDIFIEALGEEGGLMRLVLLDGENVDLFRTICRDLMSATKHVEKESEERAINIILTRLYRWQDLLRVARQSGLSKQEQLGLYGELMFLYDFFMAQLPIREAVAAWRGPIGEEQDFGYSGWLIEIKTQLSTADQSIIVSSASQLDTVSGRIRLCHQTFSAGSEADTDAQTLRGFVSKLHADIREADPVAGDLFSTILLEMGYSDREEYGELYYVGPKRRAFRVEEGFPRLTTGSIPSGIRDVRYRIDLSACVAYEVSFDDLVREVFEKP